MGLMRSRISLPVFTTLAVVLAGGALAWACTPYAYISLDPESGYPKSEVTVSGKQWGEIGNHDPVEIRWNSLSGPLLGVAPGPNFSVPVTIPQVPPGTYYIVATQLSTNGKGSAAFEVLAPPAGSSGGNPAQRNYQTGRTTSGAEDGQQAAGAGSRTSNVTSGDDGAEDSSASPEGRTAATSSSSDGVAGAPQGARAAATGSRLGTSGGRVSDRLSGGDKPGAPAVFGDGAGTSLPLPDRGTSSQQDSAGSSFPVGSPDQEPGSARQADEGQPGDVSASSELWSGFRSADTSSIPALGANSPQGGLERQLMLAMALLGAGLVGLAGAAAFGLTRRRRVAG